jgi:hypothetical protein
VTASGARRSERTNAEILQRIRQWYELYGEPPTMRDWDPYRARAAGEPWRAERYYAGDWPSVKTVLNRFGRLSAAVAAAGVPVRRQGHRRPANGVVLSDAELLRLRSHAVSIGALPATGALAVRVRAVSSAHFAQDTTALESALLDLVAAALAWAQRLRGGHGAS